MCHTGRRCGFRWNSVIDFGVALEGFSFRMTAANPRSAVEMHALTTFTLAASSPKKMDACTER